MNTVDDCRLIDLTKHKAGRRGNLTAVQGGHDVPFEISRVYYIYDVPGGESRGSHAHRNLQEVIIAVAGSFDVLLDDGAKTKRVHLSNPNHALFIPCAIWLKLENFSSGSVVLAIASENYDENDNIRHYDEFMKFRECNL